MIPDQTTEKLRWPNPAGSTLLLSIIVVSFLFGCQSGTGEAPPEPEQIKDWTHMADSSFKSLNEMYWNADDALFYSTDKHDTSLNYWWQAHAIDARVDAYERTNDPAILNEIEAHLAGIEKRNDGLINEYYDDMSWMGLALLRTYKNSSDEVYRESAVILWEDIQQGWNEHHGGGIAWNKNQPDYKNTPTSATASILGFRIYEVSEDEADLEFARKLIEWVDENLVDHATGTVYDGIGRQGDDRIDKDWLFTYNHGVYIGACLEYYDATGDKKWFEKAIKAADYATSSLLMEGTGILQDEGQGDGGLFKGIFIRYLAQLATHPDIPEDKKEKYFDFVIENAKTLWAEGKSGDYPYRYNDNWTEAPAEGVDLSTQLSGHFLMEAAATLDKDSELE